MNPAARRRLLIPLAAATLLLVIFAFLVLRGRNPPPPSSGGQKIACLVAGRQVAHVFKPVEMRASGAYADWHVSGLTPENNFLPCLRVQGTAASVAAAFRGADIEFCVLHPPGSRDEEIMSYARGQVPEGVRLEEFEGYVYIILPAAPRITTALPGELMFSANVSLLTKSKSPLGEWFEPVLLLNEVP